MLNKSQLFYSTLRHFSVNIPTNEQTCFPPGLKELGSNSSASWEGTQGVLKRINQVGVGGVISVGEAHGGYLKVFGG